MGLELKTENLKEWVYMHEMKDGEVALVIEDAYKDRIVQCYETTKKGIEYVFIISLGCDNWKSWSFIKGNACNNKVKILPKSTEFILN